MAKDSRKIILLQFEVLLGTAWGRAVINVNTSS
jgi:hypothetical protein